MVGKMLLLMSYLILPVDASTSAEHDKWCFFLVFAEIFPILVHGSDK
jgi:hypothetical protein